MVSQARHRVTRYTRIRPFIWVPGSKVYHTYNLKTDQSLCKFENNLTTTRRPQRIKQHEVGTLQPCSNCLSIIRSKEKTMSIFDASTLLDATTTDALTRRPALPAGTELLGTIMEPKPRQSQGKTDPTKVYTFLDIPIELDLTVRPDLMKQQGDLDKVTLTYGIGIDLNEAGAIDTAPGKNGRLRQLRDALGLNDPGKSFNLRMLQGRQIRVVISHRTNDGEIYDQIDKVAKV